jgi:hypothetical protein
MMSTWFSMSVRREYNGESPHAIFEEIRMLEIKFLSYFVNVSLLIIVKQKKKKKKKKNFPLSPYNYQPNYIKFFLL